MSATNSLDNPHELALRDFALGYPGTHEDMPWGHRAIKVKGKAFLFMGHEQGGLGLSVKLPHSKDAALMLPFATPTGYGLGKSGWVSASFAKGQKPPIEMLRQWIDESYRAIAPKKLVAQIGSAAEAPSAPATKKKVAAPRVQKAAAPKTPTTRKKAGTAAKRTR
ncbi:MmcQ/YjbR family DNA-binding protein [Hyalangium rubrum]|uniref:MmcQ/YjbR family DNA-binding protein n=1 Tax=Hyalangium rubrum TaxID=3103134 RepID=A0ABU5H5C5_9BACT|nr:MmcQ/YjbR family DNA-binding protein [Hyalangium sp. s54d21]MDY7228322.1 MmcQ/YjbR family DNA-binding protein [Hyalangium sp. s54d21]